MYTGVVELRKTKIALSSSLTNRGSIPEWCERLMTKLRMGGVWSGASECSELLGCREGAEETDCGLMAKSKSLWPIKGWHVTFFSTVWGGVGGWERWHPGPHVSLLQSRLLFPQSLSSFHFCPLWFKESTFSRTELPKQNNYVVNGKCLGMTAKAY